MAGEFQEARIQINGRDLTEGESMTIRVAITSYLQDIQFNGLGEDEAGRSMARGYIDNCHSVLRKIANC